MAARGQQPVSVALEPLPLPEQVVQNGTRLDGRGFEEFRPVCKYEHRISLCSLNLQ